MLDRFVRLGEGRTDRIGGYTDGFGVWRSLHAEGVAGVIRGDEAFGCRAVRGPRQVYANTHLVVLDEVGEVAVGDVYQRDEGKKEQVRQMFYN